MNFKFFLTIVFSIGCVVLLFMWRSATGILNESQAHEKQFLFKISTLDSDNKIELKLINSLNIEISNNDAELKVKLQELASLRNRDRSREKEIYRLQSGIEKLKSQYERIHKENILWFDNWKLESLNETENFKMTIQKLKVELQFLNAEYNSLNQVVTKQDQLPEGSVTSTNKFLKGDVDEAGAHTPDQIIKHDVRKKVEEDLKNDQQSDQTMNVIKKDQDEKQDVNLKKEVNSDEINTSTDVNTEKSNLKIMKKHDEDQVKPADQNKKPDGKLAPKMDENDLVNHGMVTEDNRDILKSRSKDNDKDPNVGQLKRPETKDENKEVNSDVINKEPNINTDKRERNIMKKDNEGQVNPPVPFKISDDNFGKLAHQANKKDSINRDKIAVESDQ